jgi:hypothetical protein
MRGADWHLKGWVVVVVHCWSEAGREREKGGWEAQVIVVRLSGIG